MHQKMLIKNFYNKGIRNMLKVTNYIAHTQIANKQAIKGNVRDKKMIHKGRKVNLIS